MHSIHLRYMFGLIIGLMGNISEFYQKIKKILEGPVTKKKKKKTFTMWEALYISHISGKYFSDNIFN